MLVLAIHSAIPRMLWLDHQRLFGATSSIVQPAVSSVIIEGLPSHVRPLDRSTAFTEFLWSHLEAGGGVGYTYSL